MMNRIVNVLLVTTITLFVLTACKQAVVSSGKEELIQVDEAFSKLSEKKGMKHAFLEYAAEDVVMLRKNNLPLEGIEALRLNYQTFSDTGFVLTWTPLHADIAASGELGYTFGIYTMIVNDSVDGTQENKGTYVSVWKKDNKGEWKFVLDSGNEGLSEQD